MSLECTPLIFKYYPVVLKVKNRGSTVSTVMLDNCATYRQTNSARWIVYLNQLCGVLSYIK